MFELLFLGTSASVPSAERNQPGLLIQAFDTRILLDCGEGIQRQLLRSGAGLRHLDRILLTHEHLDHVLGLPGLLTTLGLGARAAPLVLQASPAALRAAADLCAACWGGAPAPLPLELVPLEDGRALTTADFTLDAFPVAHRGTGSFGFLFATPPRRHLLPERLAALGVPDGPERRLLAGGGTVTLADGRRVAADDVLGPPTRGPRLAVIGDVESSAGLAERIGEADALVIEATYLARHAALGRRHGHLTAAEAARLAVSVGARQLFLTHISGRYPTTEIQDEARAILPGSVVAADFMRAVVP